MYVKWTLTVMAVAEEKDVTVCEVEPPAPLLVATVVGVPRLTPLAIAVADRTLLLPLALSVTEVGGPVLICCPPEFDDPGTEG
ncbi:MAG: hypothetical protein ACLPN5_23390 [Roseiarcus sp.]